MPEETQGQTDELDAIINELIKGQNKLHDRLVDLERLIDHMNIQSQTENEAADRKFWKRGL
jgi:hypothetical protein